MWYSVDIEADGPCPEMGSMIELGAVPLIKGLPEEFSINIRPIWSNYDPKALAVSGHERKETMKFEALSTAMSKFNDWIKEMQAKYEPKGRPIFLSDNNGFDWMFVCHGFLSTLKKNPFGYSSRRITDLYCGMQRDIRAKWKHLRKTKHTHQAVDDARGNAEVLLAMKEMGMNIPVVEVKK